MRLCVLANRYPVASETFISEPVAWMRARGHRVSVVAGVSRTPGSADRPSYDTGRGRLAKLVSVASAPLAAAHAARVLAGRDRAGLSLAELVFRSTLPEVRRAERLLAHFGDVGATWLPVAGLLGLPLAVYFHGYDASRTLQNRPDVYRSLFASGATLLTNSERLRRRLCEHGAPGERLHVVPLAAAPAFHAVERAGTGGAAEPLVLTVARLVPKKGLADAIHAFAQAQRALRRGWRYEIIGAGRLRAELEAVAAASGVGDLVSFRGALPRAAIVEALRRASIFLLPSKTAPDGDEDGTPVSILEATAAGVPVIATRQAGIPEILPPDEDNLLALPGDVNALADGLSRLASSPELRLRWGARCREHARAHHSPDRHLDALLGALATSRAPRLA